MNKALDPNPLERLQQEGAPLLLTDARLLGTRLYLHTWIRLFVAATIVIGAFVAKYLVGIENLPMLGLLAVAVIIALYNAAAWYLAKRFRQPEQTTTDHRRALTTMYAAIVLDFLSLTIATWLVGGTRSPFLAFYLVHVMLSCVLLSRRAAMTFASLAYAFLAALVLAEWSGLIPWHDVHGAIAGKGALDGRFVLTVLVVYGLLFGLTAFLLLTLVELLRQGEQDLRQTNAELERLSNMRRDFLHIALHNLQSPVGAATMLLTNLRTGLGGPLTDQQKEWVERVLARLDGLTGFITDLQTLSTLETRSIDQQWTPVDVPALLRTVVDDHRELAQGHGHTMKLEVARPLPQVMGIERLLREAVVNFVTNAIKYTPDGGRIILRAVHRPPFVHIEVEDNGIGISQADQNHLFDEFVRIRRDDAAVSKATGSGLGLSIVRRVIEAHHGRTYVTSRLNEGSTFVIELPAAKGEPEPAG
ncbi:MAG: HAMP domain-containing sensor histidine kinase [Planctomycetota bacterium]|nr:HAMP domain-containing sensor histidine kinase [Planctomycetota bacterium]